MGLEPDTLYGTGATCTVRGLSNDTTKGTLTLFDATGRQLMQRSIHAQHTTLDVSSLPTGIYMVQFTSPRGTTVSRLTVR